MVDTSLVFNVIAKDSTKRGFDKIKGTALVAGAAIGTAVVGGLLKTMDVDKANDKLAAQLGAGGEDAERLGQIAGNLYAGAWGDSMGQVNDAIRGVIQNIGGMEEASYEHIEGVTASVLDLTTAFDQDLGGTTRAVGKLIATGLAGDATEALDLLTRGFQTGADQAGDLLEVISEYSTMFRDVGIDAQQAMGLMGQGLQAGARDADTVADAIKEFAIRAQDGSETSAAGFKAIGLSAKDMTAAVAGGGPKAAEALDQVLDGLRGMKDPAKRNAAAVALFGTKAEDLGDALFALDLDSAAGEMGKVEGAAGRMGQTLNDNASTVLESFKRQAQAALVDKLAAAVPHIKAVGEWMSRNSAVLGPLVTVLGVFAGLVATVVVATKLWAGVMMVVKAATIAWTAVQWLLNVALSANPIGLIIIAIAALIAVIVLIATKTNWFQKLWKVVWKGIKAAAAFVWNWIKGTLWPGIKRVLNSIVAAAKGVWRGVQLYFGFWRGLLNKVIGWVVSAKNRAVNALGRIVSFVRNIPSRIRGAFSRLVGIITGPFRNAFQGIRNAWNSTIGGRGFSTPSWIPGIGGKEFRIPFLAQGGIVTGPTLAMLGEAGRPEAVIPLPRGGGSPVAVGGGRSIGPGDLRMPSGSGLDRMFIVWLEGVLRKNNLRLVSA